MNMEMSVEEIREHKAVLERAMTTDIRAWCRTFENECPVGIVGINLEFVEVTTMDSRRPKYKFSHASVELERL